MFYTARDARKQADLINEEQRSKAGKFLRTTWETALEPMIQEQASQGKYAISYHWGRSIFQEAQVYPLVFADVLKSFLEELGYPAEITTITGMGIIQDIKVFISWREETNE